MSKLHRINSAPITTEFLARIKGTFRAPEITKTSTSDDMKWQAAQYQVVQWIERMAGLDGVEPVGMVMDTPEAKEAPAAPEIAPEPIPETPARLPWWKRLWNKLRGR